MATDFTIKQNDTLPDLVVTLTDAVGSTVNITGYQGVRFIMAPKGGDSVVDAAAIVVDAENGIVKYTWEDEDTETAGKYLGEFEVQFADGRLETFPNWTYINILIKADLGGVA